MFFDRALTKISLGCFPSKLSQNRHPERSASQIYRVNSVWGAKSKDPNDAYLVDAGRTFSTTQAREQGSPCGTRLTVTGTSFHASQDATNSSFRSRGKTVAGPPGVGSVVERVR